MLVSFLLVVSYFASCLLLFRMSETKILKVLKIVIFPQVKISKRWNIVMQFLKFQIAFYLKDKNVLIL